ncbi:MAG: hypothetical protein QXN26_00900 [Thermoplasmataceae archaeon]
MRVPRFARIRPGERDDAVAEIIGAILLIAVVIVAFTGFLAWYIPTTTASNESSFQISERTAFSGIVSQMHSAQSGNGTTITGTIPLGVGGAPPFEPPTDTSLSIFSSGAGYHSLLSVNLSYTATNLTGSRTVFVQRNITAAGEIQSGSQMQYITAINYIIEDGSLLESYGSSQPASFLGPLPISITPLSIGLDIFSLSGQNETFSGTDPATLSFTVSSGMQLSLSNQSLSVYGGHVVAVSNITLHSLSYSISSPLYETWNHALYVQFNNSLASYTFTSAISSWNFTGMPLAASTASGEIHINLISPVHLQALNIRDVVLVQAD